MSDIFKDPTTHLKKTMERLTTPLYFDELFALAEETCLSKSLVYSETSIAPHPEAIIISGLGARGLRAALELSNKHISMDSENKSEEQDYESEQQRPIMLDTTIRLPDRFSDSINQTIMTKVEVFGSAIINESFQILGQDAHEQAERLRQATSAEEQVSVINWLDTRLSSIIEGARRDAALADDNDRHFYHPVRLSPKFIGSYPEHTLPPTCLGVSIIATSFLEKAGLEVLHAGVVESAQESKVLSSFLLLASLEDTMAERYHTDVPHSIQRSLTTLAYDTLQHIEREDAQHVAVYARLLDDSWLQFDPNYYGTTQIYDDDNNKELSRTLATLKEIEEIAPGVELTQSIMPPITVAEIARAVVDAQDPAIIDVLRESAYTALQRDITESLPQHVFETCVLPFFTAPTTNKPLSILKGDIRQEEINIQGRWPESQLQNNFYAVFEKYVLWGDSVESVHRRAQTDKRYLQERVEDILRLPFLILAAMAVSESESATFEQTHATVELGLPHTRIGLAVLSDFALYTHSPLPSSFWLSHWPGDVSVTEHMHGASRSSEEDSLIYNNLIYRLQHSLTSRKNAGMIKEFLALRHTEIGDSNAQD